MKLIVIAPPTFDGISLLRERNADIDILVAEDPAVLARELPDAEIVTVASRHGRLFRELWPLAKSVRWVHSLGAGIDALMFEELLSSDVVLTNSRGIFADALGEFAVAAMLWFAKDLRRMVTQQLEHAWKPYVIKRLEGHTVGIIGLGGIGRAVARRVDALGMRVIATRRHASSSEAHVERMYALEDLGELLQQSDYVVLSTPLTPSTRGLFDASRFARMKSDAVLINISRGAVADEKALVAALAERRIRGAALDVFEQEPLPADHPLWSLDNVLLSPHNADRVEDSHLRAMKFFIRNLEHYRRGEPLENIVDKSAQY